MFKIPKKIEYALMAVKTLNDESPNNFLSAREISQRAGIPYQFTAKTLQQLMKLGLIKSQSGSNGGYALNNVLSQLTLLDFFELMGEYPALIECSTQTKTNKLKIEKNLSYKSDTNNYCVLHNNCTIQKPLSKIQTRLEGLLKSIILKELM
jgi:Rrf2 family protein